MSEAKTDTGLLEPDQAWALWTWIWAVLEDPQPPHFAWRARIETAEALLDVAVYLAGELALAGRHEWVARLPEMLRMHRGWLIYENEPERKCLVAVSDLLHQGAPLTKAVRGMARSPDPNVRHVVASSLRISDDDARALIETLTTDADQRVRKVARQRLPPGRPAAWWVGKFESDPIPRLSESSDEILAALRTVALFADRESHDERLEMIPQLAEALALVPDPLLFEFGKRFVTFDWTSTGYATILDAILTRPAGPAALWSMLRARLGRPHDWAHLYMILSRLHSDISPAAVELLCRGLLQGVVEHRGERRAASMTQLAERVLAEYWPASLPGALVLDAWHSLTKDAPKLATHLQPLLSNARVDLLPELGRLLPLAEADETLVTALSSIASRLEPEPRRALAARALTSESEAVRVLGLEQLTTLAPEPPDTAQGLFTRHWPEPALRKAMSSNDRLAQVFCPQLRRQLRAGALELSEIAATLRAVGHIYGGVGDDGEPPSEAEAAKRAARRELALAWHEGTTELGPPSEDEWVMWRTARRQALDDNPKLGAGLILAVRPPGPLSDEDRALVDALMADWREAWDAVDPAELDNPSGAHWRATMRLFFSLDGVLDAHVLEQLEVLHAKLEVIDNPLIEMMQEHLERMRERLASKRR